MKNRNQVFLGPKDVIGTRPNEAIQALTVSAVGDGGLSGKEIVDNAHLKLVLDYMTWLEMKAALLDTIIVQAANLPMLVEQAVQLAEDTASVKDMATEPNKWFYNVEGHVCPQTNRKAMTVAQVIELQNKGDVHSYTYDGESASCGLDPWRLVDSINPFTKEPKAELWFDNGGSKDVPLDAILYVQQPKKKGS